MSEENRKKTPGKSLFQFAADILSGVVAILATVLLTPRHKSLTADRFVEIAGSQWGADWVPFLRFIWSVGVAAGTFALCVMLTSATLSLGFAKLAILVFRR